MTAAAHRRRGVYAVRFFKEGRERIVIIDDHIPWDEQETKPGKPFRKFENNMPAVAEEASLVQLLATAPVCLNCGCLSWKKRMRSCIRCRFFLPAPATYFFFLRIAEL